MNRLPLAATVVALAALGYPAAAHPASARQSSTLRALPTSCTDAGAMPGRCALVTIGPVAPTPPLIAGVPCPAPAVTCPRWTALHDGRARLGDWASGSAMDAAGTTLFTAGYTYTSPTSAVGQVVAYRASDGSELWTVERPVDADLPISVLASVQATPDGRTALVVGSAYTATECRPVVAAYDGRTGRLRWDSSLPVGPAPCEYYADSTITPDGKRFVITTNVPSSRRYGGQRATEGLTVAFDVGTGRRLWRTATPQKAYGYKNWRTTVSPDGTAVYVVADRLGASSDTTTTAIGWTLSAYATKNGRRLWSTDYDCTRDYGSATVQAAGGHSAFCVDPSAVVAVGPRVFLSGSNGLGYSVTQIAAFDARTGRRLWHVDRDPLRSFIYLNRALAVGPDGSGIYAGHVRIDPDLVEAPQFVVERLDVATGAVRWSRAVAANTSAASYCGGCGPLIGADRAGHVYLAGSYPLGNMVLTLATLDARTGTVTAASRLPWSAGGLALELPQSLSVPGKGRGFGLAGAALNPSTGCADAGCHDAAALLFDAGT